MSPIPQQAQETRERILSAAVDEIHKEGFERASLSQILKTVNLTKGAFYHHFSSKKELGLSVIQEAMAQHIEYLWLKPLQEYEDPIAGLMEHLKSLQKSLTAQKIRNGCPLNNLSQELAGRDEDFRKALASTYDIWISGFENIFAKGQKNGFVTKALSAHCMAAIVVCNLEGIIGLTKTFRSKKVMENNNPAFMHILKSFQP